MAWSPSNGRGAPRRRPAVDLPAVSSPDPLRRLASRSRSKSDVSRTPIGGTRAYSQAAASGLAGRKPLTYSSEIRTVMAAGGDLAAVLMILVTAYAVTSRGGRRLAAA